MNLGTGHKLSGGGGGLQNGRGGGHVKFYPFEKGSVCVCGGGGGSFSHAEGGAQQVLRLF